VELIDALRGCAAAAAGISRWELVFVPGKSKIQESTHTMPCTEFVNAIEWSKKTIPKEQFPVIAYFTKFSLSRAALKSNFLSL
jgi:hypothetical protein